MKKSYDNLIKLAIKADVENSEDFLRLKKDICKQLGVQPPTNADLREHYEKMVKKYEIKRSPAFEKILLSKKVRTESGVAVVAVLTKPYPCPGKCIYCPTEKEMPKSYLSNEPAVMRAISSRFNPYKQVRNRLRALELNGHAIDKIELIVMGGTFSYLPKPYQKKFITECFRACNEYGVHKVYKVKKFIKNPVDKLLQEQRKNEKAKCRIVGLTLETRPDYVDEEEILNFRNLGCTRVELGVQSIFDDVLKLNRRGHNISETIRATKLLKDAGFKINYHIMPGLPGSTPKKDRQMFQKLFCDQNFQPDMLKIYPTVVTKNTKLHSLWKKGDYKPLTDKNFKKLILDIKNNLIPPYVRIARLVRDVPEVSIVAGPKISNLRQLIEKESLCQCIRCREVKSEYTLGENIILERIDYEASDGKEIFLQYVSQDKTKLFALLRLRIPQEKNAKHFIPALRNAALIREVHTYGKLKSIEDKHKTSLPASLRPPDMLTQVMRAGEALQAGPQHIGLGKKLLLEAERIAKKEFSLKKIVVISGVGVRGYYKKSGYRLKDTYMSKNL